MKWRVEVWSLPDDPDGFRLIDTPDVLAAHTGDRDDAVGYGEITLPADYPYLDQIIQVDPTDPSKVKASLISFWREGETKPDYEFFAEELVETLASSGATATVKGPEVRSGPDEAIVYPRTDTEGDWIWGGRNVLPDLQLGNLQNIRAEWQVIIERERYGLSITATGGTFTLSFDGNTTDSINHDASANTIKSRLEDLPGISSVYAVKHEDDSYTVVVLNPTDLGSDITINTGNLTGGSATWTKQADGFDSSGSPTFTLEVTTSEGSDETEATNFNASASTLEARLQALSNVLDVTVSGSGTYDDPWHIIFYNPPVIDDLQCTFAAGSTIVEEMVEGGLNPSPITQSQFADQRINPAIHGKYAATPIEVVTDNLDSNASWALQVNAEGQFAGSQVVFNVTPGQTYQASIRVKPTVDGLYRLVIRDVYEELIKWTSPVEVPLTAGTYQELSVPDVRIPAGTNQVIMRVAVVSANASEIDTFYVNWEDAQFQEGMPRTTIGDIVGQLTAAARDRGALAWLKDGFTDTHDSNNVEWDEDISFRADVGEQYGTHVLGDALAVGYPYDVVRLDTPDGNFTHELRLFNPGSRGTSEQAIVMGSFQKGRLGKRRPHFTHLLVEDDQGGTTEVTDTDLSGLTRREGFVRAEFAPDATAAQRVGEQQFGQQTGDLLATQITLADDTVVPYRDFDVGWELPYDLGSRAGHHNRTVHSIVLSLQGGVWTAEITASRMFEDAQSATLEAIRKLYAEFARRRRPRPSGAVLPGGGKGMAHILVVSDSEPAEVQSKADFVVPAEDSSSQLQQIFDTFGNGGTVWMAGSFTLTSDVEVWGNGVRVRGLGGVVVDDGVIIT